MIRPAQLKLLDRARSAVASDAAEFAAILRRYGGADRVEELTTLGYSRLLDYFTVNGFRDKKHPILSERTFVQIQSCKHELGISDHVFVSWLRRDGASGLEMLTGTGLLNLLILFESCGADVRSFNLVRTEISDRQLKFLNVARKKLAYRTIYSIRRCKNTAASTTPII